MIPYNFFSQIFYITQKPTLLYEPKTLLNTFPRHKSLEMQMVNVTASNGQEFNIYGRNQKLSDEEVRNAAVQLQEILNMLPDDKTEYTASKTVTLDTLDSVTYSKHAGCEKGVGTNFNSYGLPNNLGSLKSVSHTEQITAAYASKNPYDLYNQMRKQKQNEEAETYQHSNDVYDYNPLQKKKNSNTYKHDNYHVHHGSYNNRKTLNDLAPIIAALEVAKHQHPAKTQISYAVEKNVHKAGVQSGAAKSLLPVVQKTKYIFYDPTAAKYEHYSSINKPSYNGALRVNRSTFDVYPMRFVHRLFDAQKFDNPDMLLYNSMISVF